MMYLIIQDYYGEKSQLLLDQAKLCYSICCDKDHHILIDPVIKKTNAHRVTCEICHLAGDHWGISTRKTPDPSMNGTPDPTIKYNHTCLVFGKYYPLENGSTIETQEFTIIITNSAPDNSIPMYPASAILQELQKNQETNTTSAINHISHPNQMGYGPIPQYYPNQTGLGVALAPNGSPPFFVKKK